jgi:hypothetical protein
MTQPEALRLADWMEWNDASMEVQNEAAAELRRLHEVNQELLAALKAYQKAGFGQSTDHHLQGDAYDLAIKAIARAAIAKGEAK